MNDILVLSHHRKLTMKRCNLLHEWKYNHKYSKPNYNTNFLYGTAMHKVMELYYANKDKDIGTEDLKKEFWVWMKKDVTDDSLLLELQAFHADGDRLIEIYYQLTNGKENFKVLAVEHSYILDVDMDGEVKLSKENRTNLLFKIAGKIDMIIEDQEGNVYVWDNKTTSLDEDVFIKHMMDDEQLLNYSLYGQLMYGDKFKGVVVNGLNKKLKPKPIYRHYFSYTNAEIEYVIGDFISVAKQYYTFKDHKDIMEQRNQQFDCKDCEFQEPSMAKRKGHDYQQILDLFYEKFDKFDWE